MQPFITCSKPLSPEGGAVHSWQKGLNLIHPGAANMCVIGQLAGNAQRPGGIWETGVI